MKCLLGTKNSLFVAEESPLDGYALISSDTENATPKKFKVVAEECAGDFFLQNESRTKKLPQFWRRRKLLKLFRCVILCQLLRCLSAVKVDGKTGVEMDALHAASVALLTTYDMCKAVDKQMEIRTLHLLKKSGDFFAAGTFYNPVCTGVKNTAPQCGYLML